MTIFSTTQGEIIHLLDLFGTGIFAITGSLAAGNKRMDVFGVLVLGLVTAIGGGTLRDLLLGQCPVFWIKNITILEQKLLSSEKHIKFILQDDRFKFKKVSALLWHRAAEYTEDYVGKKADFIFTFGKESKGFGAKFYLQIVDFKINYILK